jgi:hypothetical protein
MKTTKISPTCIICQIFDHFKREKLQECGRLFADSATMFWKKRSSLE